MKRYLIIFFLVSSICVAGQVLKSNAPKITIRDGAELKKDYWTISPTVKPDVYETVSSGTAHKVTFITDIDSITFNVTLNEQYSFVVLLNNTDSAFTQISGVEHLSGISGYVPSPPLTSSQLKHLAEAVTPFSKIYATRSGEKQELADLRSFGNVIGDAQIIALGESTHGTSEFFSLKHRALEYAITNLNVRVFALEDNQLHVEQVNGYVLHGKGSLRTIMRGLFGVWVRQEVLTMIEWIREYNLHHPDKKVEFVGFDMQSPFMALDSLQSFLSKNDPELNSRIREMLSDYRKDFANSYSAGNAVKNNWFKSTDQAFNLVRSQEANWLKTSKTKADSASVKWAVQNARVIRQSARSILTGQMKLYRDSAMAENIKWILSMRKPGTRMVVWAHDFHISRGDNPVAENNYYNGVSMGSWLSKWYGKKYKAFGLETFSGAFTAMKTYTDFELINCTLVNSPVGTLDEALHQIAEKKQHPYLFLDLNKVLSKSKDFEWLIAPTYVRFANHVCEGNSYNLKHSIPYQFDGLFFVDQTTGSKLIK